MGGFHQSMAHTYGAARMGCFAAPREPCEEPTEQRCRETSCHDFSASTQVKIPVPPLSTKLQNSPGRSANRLYPTNPAGEPLTRGSLTQRNYAPQISPGGPHLDTQTHGPKTYRGLSSRKPELLPGAILSPREVGISGYAGHIPFTREIFGLNTDATKGLARTICKLPAIAYKSVSIPPRFYYNKRRGEVKTPIKFRRNRSNGMLGDDRLAEFSSVANEVYAGHPVPEPPIQMTPADVKKMYDYATSRVNKLRVDQMELMLRQKISQRTRGGGFALRRAFTFFDRDGSGGVSTSELRQGLRDFGLQYSDEEVGALMARYDTSYSNDVDYLSFVDKIMADSWSGK